MSNGLRYKYCVVPECKSSTLRTPDKLFFSMPTGQARLVWCRAMGRDRNPAKYKPLSPKCNRFCCEDHFDKETDMNNYIKWKIMGTKKLFLKKGVVPHKFDCQNTSNVTKPYAKGKTLTRSRKVEKTGELKVKPFKEHNQKLGSPKGQVISFQKTKEKVSNITKEIRTDSMQTIEKYTFHVKVEVDNVDEMGDEEEDEQHLVDLLGVTHSSNNSAHESGGLTEDCDNLEQSPEAAFQDSCNLVGVQVTIEDIDDGESKL